MSPPSLKLNLLVDGSPRDSQDAVWHYQEDPFPGGHRYELRVSGTLTRRLRSILKKLSTPVPRRESNQFFNELYLARARADLRYDTAPRDGYVLNTIESFSLEPGVIILQGVCSPVVRPNQQQHS